MGIKRKIQINKNQLYDKFFNIITDLTHNEKFIKFKAKIRILETANELINLALSLSNVSIACDSVAEGERLSERGDTPTIMFRPIVVKATMGLSDSERDGGINIEFGCKPPVNAGLTLCKVR